ncbi:MAG: DUF6448 family protein [Armatimonadota bacterium]|jgi:hypothetical protein
MMVCAFLAAVTTGAVWAHCDRINGPVAKDAISALEQRDFGVVQIWVGEDQELELRARFDEALTVGQQSEAAREMAERYFIETAIRLHREAEGMHFTGVKPAAEPSPDIAAAERALEMADVTIVTDYLKARIDEEVGAWFAGAREAQGHRHTSVEAGRKWIDAYVKYVVFIHTLSEVIEAGPPHGAHDH